MTDRELKKLSRAELLELLLEQLRENEQLQVQIDELRERLAQRELKIDQAGSIAEASLQLSGVFEAAQDACSQYIENIQQLSARQEQLCAQMEQETQRKCEQMVAEAKSQSQAFWDEVFRKVRELTSSYAELRNILQQPQIRD